MAEKNKYNEKLYGIAYVFDKNGKQLFMFKSLQLYTSYQSITRISSD